VLGLVLRVLDPDLCKDAGGMVAEVGMTPKSLSTLLTARLLIRRGAPSFHEMLEYTDVNSCLSWFTFLLVCLARWVRVAFFSLAMFHLLSNV